MNKCTDEMEMAEFLWDLRFPQWCCWRPGLLGCDIVSRGLKLLTQCWKKWNRQGRCA